MEGNSISQRFRLQAVVVAIGTILMAMKFAAYFLTHSESILTDALESIVNIAAGCFALYSLWLAAKPRDEDHPYGHGKIEFVAASFEGILIMVAGGSIVLKAINSLWAGNSLHNLDVGMVLIAITGVVNYIMGATLIRTGKQANSPTLVAEGKHLQSDTYSSLGLVAGLLAVRFSGYEKLDSIFAIVFGAWIAITGWRVLRHAIGGIMDEADYELLQSLVSHWNAHRQPNWIDIHNLRIIRYGSDIHIDCHLTVPHYFSVQQAHDELQALDDLAQQHFPEGVEIFIHTDPCIPESCRVCQRETCAVRQFAFEQPHDWTLDALMRNRKHGI